MKRSRRSVLKVSAFLTCLLLVFGLKCRTALAAQDENTICDGVYIDGINVSNMTAEEAKQAVKDYELGLSEKEVAVVLDEEVALTTVGDLGYACSGEEDAYIEEALMIGKMGNLIKRYKDLKDVKHGGLHYEMEFSLDGQKVDEFIQSQCSIYDVAAKNAAIQRQNGQFVYTDSVVGQKVNVQATKEAIEDAILKDWNQENVTIDAVIEEDVPKYTLEMVQKSTSLLGSYTTRYPDSSTERKNNISNAVRLINNTVVYPGEVFSCYEKMQPFTTENGYYSAHAYVNGMVEDSIGGGVCQVSTTLYNAVLLAELEVVQRAPHSMTVNYVPYAFDAAIAGTYKDLKFTNNYDVPILIEAIANGTTLTFNIYGYETRPANREIKFESKILSTTKPKEDIITKDPTQPESYRKVTQSAHTGYVALMLKHIYEDGNLVKTIQVNKSVYNATPAYVTVGSKVEEKPEEDKKDEESKDEESKDENDKPEDKPTEKPEKPTEKPDKPEKPAEKPTSKPEVTEKPVDKEEEETDKSEDESQEVSANTDNNSDQDEE